MTMFYMHETSGLILPRSRWIRSDWVKTWAERCGQTTEQYFRENTWGYQGGVGRFHKVSTKDLNQYFKECYGEPLTDSHGTTRDCDGYEVRDLLQIIERLDAMLEEKTK